MSEVSIGSIRLPRLRAARAGERIAREAVFRVLGQLERGSLTLHEGPRSLRFGGDAEPHAEVHVHDPAAYAQMLGGGSIAAGETYMRGLWSSPGPATGDPAVLRQHGGAGTL